MQYFAYKSALTKAIYLQEMHIVSIFRINFDILSFRSGHKSVLTQNAKLCSTLLSRQSRSVSEIMKFSCWLWMMSSSFFHQGALLIILPDGYYSFTGITHEDHVWSHVIHGITRDNACASHVIIYLPIWKHVKACDSHDGALCIP